MNNLYYGAWDEFKLIANDFLLCLMDSIEYSLDGRSAGDVKIIAFNDTKLIKFIINNIHFEFNGRLIPSNV